VNGEDNFACAAVIDEQVKLGGERDRPARFNFTDNLTRAGRQTGEFLIRVLQTEATVVSSTLHKSQHAYWLARVIVHPQGDVAFAACFAIGKLDVRGGDFQ
jgi:hypothetical protein